VAAGLVAAYVTEERAGGKALTVREFVAHFHGLSGTVKRKQVVAAARLCDARLRDLVRGDDLDMAAVGRLLSAMQGATRPLKPKALGVLGRSTWPASWSPIGTAPRTPSATRPSSGTRPGCRSCWRWRSASTSRTAAAA
jgi:hypothetical protein